MPAIDHLYFEILILLDNPLFLLKIFKITHQQI